MKKKTFLAICLAVFMVFVLTPAAYSCSSWVETEGGADIGVFNQHGNNNTGGYAMGEAGAGYGALGTFFVAGEANAAGCAFGGSFQGSNKAFSGNLVGVSSDACALGQRVNTGAGGYVQQGNWAQVDSPNAYASGGNFSEAGYDAGNCGHCYSFSEGSALTGGFTAVEKTNGCFTNTARGVTSNFAQANVDQGTSCGHGGDRTFVAGQGEMYTGTQKVGPTGYAGASNGSSFGYEGRNAGSGCAAGNSSATLVRTPFSTCAGAHSDSRAGAHSN